MGGRWAQRHTFTLALWAAASGWLGGAGATARAEVESIVVRLEEARCFS
jgi:hypothetical protein